MMLLAVLFCIVGGFPRKGPRKEEAGGRTKWVVLTEVCRYVLNCVLKVFDTIFLEIFKVFDIFGWGHLCLLGIILYFFLRKREGKAKEKKSEVFENDLEGIERIYDDFTVPHIEKAENNLEILIKSVKSLKNDVTSFQSSVFDIHLNIWKCVSQ